MVKGLLIYLYRFSEKKDRPNEEQGKNDNVDIYDKNNKKKVMEIYQNYVEQDLENQRKEQLKENGSKLFSNMNKNRCPR
jgi:hypothetical protein